MSATLQAKIDSVRQRTLEALDALTAAAPRLELPPPPEALAVYRGKLAAGAYTVLVVGEAKRGKSSFVNAIIGRALLPVDEKIATSQAFRISDGPRESFQVRYADGSRVQIGAEALAHYGSQLPADRPGIPLAGEVISWIEVQVPARFLPAGVTLIDTPGVGSLYMSHAQITHRFIANADAVIFVLDSERPIIQEELDFLAEILRVTRSVFFIQTKIDLYSRDAWKAILDRNLAILRSHFGEELPDPTIWPCSNEHLMHAADTDDEDYLRASRYDDLAVALQTFLFDNAGWLAAAEAVGLAAVVYNDGRSALATRLAALNDERDQQAADLEAQLLARKQQFSQEWSARGQRRQTLLADLRALAARQQQAFLAMLRPGGAIDKQMRARIAAVRSFEDAEKLNRQLPGAIVSEAQLRWRQIRQETEIQSAALLGPLIEAGAALRFPHGIADKPDPSVSAHGQLMTAASYQELVRLIYQNHGRIIRLVADYLVRAEVLDPREAIAYAEWAARMWAMAYGWYRRNQIERGAAQQQLLAHHEAVLSQIESYFIAGDGGPGSHGAIRRYFDELVRLVGEQVETISAEQLQAAEAELERLAAGMRLGQDQRKERAAQAQSQLDEWDAIGRALRGVFDELKTIA